MVQVLQGRSVDRRRHAAALRDSTRLTQIFYRMYRPGEVMVTPAEIIEVLNKAGVDFVLMGTHGVGGWRSEPRASDDVDFLIAASSHRKAVAAITKAFPKLKKKAEKVVTRFRDPTTKRIVVDLMKPCAPYYLEVFKNTVPAGQTHRIPDLEMALVSKFAALMSPLRIDKKKSIDAGDFMDIVDTNSEIIDMEKLQRLAALVCSDGAEKIVEFVEDARAGRIPNFRRTLPRDSEE
jgi:hypothetical protein